MRNAVFVALALLMTAPAFAAEPTAASTFTFRIAGEPETLDWNRAHTPVETYLLMNLMEGLVAFDEKLKVVPELAESWTVSKDQKTYTFKLRSGVQWTDGVPLKAKDFVYSWKRLLSPVTAAAYSYFLFDIEGAEDFYKGKLKDFSKVGIKAVDDQTFQVTLTQPIAHWPMIPTFWVTFPMREDIVARHGTSWATPGRMVTLGPYSLTQHDADSKLVLKASPTYYGKRSNVEQAVALVVSDDSTALNLYEAGKLDFLTDIAAIDLARMSSRPDFKTFPYLKTAYLGFVFNRYPTSNPGVRKAIAMAIDRSKFGDLLHGGQKPASSWVPPGMLGHSASIGIKFDPAAARSALKSSGVDLEKPLQLELLLPNADKQLTVAQYLQAELKKNLGVEIVLQPFDNKTFRAQIDLHQRPTFLLTWSADYPDPDNFLSVFLSDSGNNHAKWKNAKLDQLVLSARRNPVTQQREKAYAEAQKLLQETDVAVLPLYYEPNNALQKPRVKKIHLDPLNYLYIKKVSLGP